MYKYLILFLLKIYQSLRAHIKAVPLNVQYSGAVSNVGKSY